MRKVSLMTNPRPDATFDQWIAAQARFRPDKPAIIFETFGETAVDASHQVITYTELQNQIERTVSVLANRLSLKKGDRLAWLGHNHPEMLVLLAAAARLGVVVTPLNWRLSTDELGYALIDSGTGTLFHDTGHGEVALQLQAIAEKSELALQLVALEGDSNHSLSLLRENTDPVLSSSISNLTTGDDAALLVYTSGTTGRPKGAVLPHRALVCNARMSQHMHDLVSTDCILNVLPLFHVGGINIQSLPALMHGATLVLHRTFNPEHALDSIARNNVSLMVTVPTLLQALLAADRWGSTDKSHLKALSIGSTDVALELIEQLHNQDIPVIQVYGATETGPTAIYQTIDMAMSTAGSIGRQGLLCDISIRDPAGNEVATGETGEICVRGDNILTHYWNNPAETSKTLVDGWFYTGDIAAEDSEGNYWFRDRLKHVIISGGENIYPAEIERVVAGLAGVAEVSVVGIPDARWGDVPVAVIVPGGSETNQEPEGLKDEILGACREQLASFKVPKQVVVVEELPRNALGKVLVDEVRKLVVG